MKRFIEGYSRTQSTLLPECLDDFINEDNPIRAVDVFVDQLDLGALGFDGISPASTGRPSYHPTVLLKLYIYGYLNKIQSSRRLEREAQRNVELMWLTGRLAPDFKTIADFRKDNGKAIRQVSSQFVALCRELHLFSEGIVAIDGSKFKAVNAHDQNFTRGKLAKRMQQIDECIHRYLIAMETADRQPADIAQARTTRLKEKIETLKRQMTKLKDVQQVVETTPAGQVSLTDPDARAMATSTSRGLVGYNVQIAVEPQHHLIVAHEVTNIGNDRRMLFRIAHQAKQAIGKATITAIADRGYYNGEEIVACETDNITPIVPKPRTSSARSEGRFDKDDFIFDASTGEYRCPAGSRLIWRFASKEDGYVINRYWSSDCPSCVMKDQCTPSKYRRISRYEHEDSLEAMQQKIDKHPEVMRIRRQTVEHPFGTIKDKEWMGANHFLMRSLKRVKTEMSLHVLAYNMKRVMNMLGIERLIAAMTT